MKKTHTRLPSSQAFDHLVYLRIFEGCNLHCLHCFVPSNPKRMSSEAVTNVPNLLENRIPKGQTVLLQWHGGEPTLLGSRYIADGIKGIEANTNWHWRHGIQTNLMTYDAEWKTLLHRHFASEIGVSWDPTIRLMNKHAKDSHARVKAVFDDNLKRVMDDGITPYLVVTATKTLFEAYKNPFAFFEEWRQKGVRHVHLERVTQTGFARDNWSVVGLDNAAYSENMARWARAYHLFRKENPDSGFYLSPFINLHESVRGLLGGKPQAHGCWSGQCDTTFHTIDAEGYKAGCTALTSEMGNKNARPPVIRNSGLSDQRAMRVYDCRACVYQNICKTGCLALDFDDGSGECSGGKSLFSAIYAIEKVQES